jgi:hypothetical protein
MFLDFSRPSRCASTTRWLRPLRREDVHAHWPSRTMHWLMHKICRRLLRDRQRETLRLFRFGSRRLAAFAAVLCGWASQCNVRRYRTRRERRARRGITGSGRVQGMKVDRAHESSFPRGIFPEGNQRLGGRFPGSVAWIQPTTPGGRSSWLMGFTIAQGVPFPSRDSLWGRHSMGSGAPIGEAWWSRTQSACYESSCRYRVLATKLVEHG